MIKLLVLTFFIAVFGVNVWAAKSGSPTPNKMPVKTEKAKSKAAFTLEEFNIEGKLKKPQMVLISADERPRFQPMAINKYNSKNDLMSTIDQSIFEYEIYQKAFSVNP
jgi:hypothetical protein